MYIVQEAQGIEKLFLNCSQKEGAVVPYHGC